MRLAAALSVLLMAGCGADAPGSAGRSDLALVPAPGGLDTAGSGGREIGFGRDRPGVLESVGRIEGQVPRPVDCGSGREAYATSENLRLVFEGRTFVGWESPDAAAGRGCR